MNVDIKLFKNDKELYTHCLYLHPLRIFYNLNGDTKTPTHLDFSQNKFIPSYILNIMKKFAEAYSIYINKVALVNPLKEGIYFDKGAKFIDILIEDIPVQKGLVSADLIDNSTFFKKVNKLHGKSIKIILDRNLIENTATPIHELFHVFQYNYCNFNNMWFMEGLARWSQNLTHTRKMIDEKLPQSLEDIQYLLSRKHDAEYFFRKLISLSTNEDRFIKLLLKNCVIQEKILSKEQSIKTWNRENKKSAVNNEYILKAILDTLKTIEARMTQELKVFIEISSKYINLDKKALHLNSLENIKLIDKNLTIDSTNIVHINGFNDITKIDTLVIKNNTRLLSIKGFKSLVEIKNLEIANNVNLETIKAFEKLFSVTQAVDGYIKIISNKKLNNIAFLDGLISVKSSFYLHYNAIVSLKGLGALEYVGASFSLASNKISSLMELSHLKEVNGSFSLVNNQLKSLSGLENLSKLKTKKWNTKNRTLAIFENKKLKDIEAIKNIRTDDKYIIIEIDNYKQYQKIPKMDSVFAKNTLEIYDKSINEIIASDLFKAQKNIEIPNILFGYNWENATRKCLWMHPHHINFKNIQSLIEYTKENNINILFANNYNTQKAILKNVEVLKKHNLKFIVNNEQALKNFVDKQLFYDIMLANNFEQYVPKYYNNPQEIQYPCMVKIKSGGAGRGMFIAYDETDLEDVKSNMIVSEYLSSNTEYASSIFTKDGKVIKHITYSKTSANDVYILQHEDKKSIKVQRCETLFLKIFEEIILAMSGDKAYCQCSVNFKILNGIPKIFEINPRIGYTLAGFPDDFKEMMDCYIGELDNE